MSLPRRWRRLCVPAVAVAATLATAAPGVAGTGTHGAAAREQQRNAYIRAHGGPASATHTPNDGDLADQLAQYEFERTAPATSVSAQALIAARTQAGQLPTTNGGWAEVTTAPYNAEPSGYTDPFWSNIGAGWSLVGGRTTALVADSHGSWYAGTADGGVWKSTDQGGHWAPTFDAMPTLSVGALSVNPADGSLWVGTGEANTNSDSYQGTGVYRSSDGGSSYQRVGDTSSGGNPIASRTVYRIAFDGAGNVYAATSDGLFRTTAAGTGGWTEVLDPAGTSDFPPYYNQITDVTVVPGSGGQSVLAVDGWRGPNNATNDADNGFYLSTDGGNTFTKIRPTGQIDANDIGRTTFAYSHDGSTLYAVVESPSMLAAGDESVLQGVFVSTQGPAGPWKKIADEKTLAGSGSALAVGSGYGVGVQAWYNQDLAVDPGNAKHVYLGLEEVFESTDAGANWVTASPYWNYGLACNPNCPNGTHPDQHAMMISNGKLVIGNDGGVYSRPLTDTQQYGDWTDLNATLHSWQYYDARAGKLGTTGTGVWGGLQDNGTSLLTSGSSQMVEPAGGDGFDVIVDPSNANNAVGEYTYMTMYSTTDGGHSFNPHVSPGCIAQEIVGLTPRADCDPNARFAAPITFDQQNKNTWVAGGQDVWVSTAGWRTSCDDTACSWTKAYDTGSGHVVTALSSAGGVIYAAWVNGSGNPSSSFATGIATNEGGSWHEVNTTGLPDRYIAGVYVDPGNPAHAYAIYNGYSRRWIPSAGVGHVYETTDGGKSWTDISNNLPDAPADALVIVHRTLVLATDIGMFTAAEGQGASTSWSRLGTGLPNASVNDVTVGPDGSTVYAATHGRGIWRLTVR